MQISISCHHHHLPCCIRTQSSSYLGIIEASCVSSMYLTSAWVTAPGLQKSSGGELWQSALDEFPPIRVVIQEIPHINTGKVHWTTISIYSHSCHLLEATTILQIVFMSLTMVFFCCFCFLAIAVEENWPSTAAIEWFAYINNLVKPNTTKSPDCPNRNKSPDCPNRNMSPDCHFQPLRSWNWLIVVGPVAPSPTGF